MPKKFMIFVIDALAESATPQEMAAIDAFNDKLRAQGHWIVAGGLAHEASQACHRKVELRPLLG